MEDTLLRMRAGCDVSHRWKLVWMMFAGDALTYMMRVNLSIVMPTLAEEHGWPASTQGVVLSAFFYGYTSTQAIGGVLAKRFGGRATLAAGILLPSLLTLLLPFVAHSLPMLVLFRVLTGITEGLVYPTFWSLMPLWLPVYERSRASTVILSGAAVGTMIGVSTGGFLTQHVGWKSVFLVHGAGGVFWLAAWLHLAADSPARCRHVQPDELALIEQSAATLSSPDVNEALLTKKHASEPVDQQSSGFFSELRATVEHVPFREIFTSVPVIALIMTHVCVTYYIYLDITWTAIFVQQHLRFSPSQAGLILMLPTLGSLFVGNVSAQVVDAMVRRRVMSTTRVRKLFLGLGAALASVLICIAPWPSKRLQQLILLILSRSFFSFVGPSFGPNFMDLTPRHSGILLGVSNTLGSVSGIVAPTVAGFVLHHTVDPVIAWRIIWMLCGGVILLGGTVFVAFGSAVPVLRADREQAKTSTASAGDYLPTPDLATAAP